MFANLLRGGSAFSTGLGVIFHVAGANEHANWYLGLAILMAVLVIDLKE
jgi:hypothetical protein